MSVVTNIKVLCKQHQTTIPELEKELGFGRGSIYKWGTNEPSIGKVQKVALRFGVSVDFLLSGCERYEPFTSETIVEIAKKNKASIGDVITVLDEAKSLVLSKPLEKMEEVSK